MCYHYYVAFLLIYSSYNTQITTKEVWRKKYAEERSMQKKEVCKFAKRMTKMTGDCNKVENPRMISTKKCKPLISKMQKKEVCKFAKRMTKMTGDCNKVENPRMISTKKCKSLISKMLKNETHPLYPYITTLPHGHLRVPWSRTERFRKSFLPYAIKLFNSDWYKLGYKLH